MEHHKTEPIRKQDMRQLYLVANTIAKKYINIDYWILRINKGSLTLQNKPEKPEISRKRADFHEVITVFKDYENKLAKKCNLNIHDDPVVVAIELCPQPAFIRKNIREELKQRGDDHYIDGKEFHIAPKQQGPDRTEHRYDILFLRKGACEKEFAENYEMFREKFGLAEGTEISVSDLP